MKRSTERSTRTQHPIPKTDPPRSVGAIERRTAQYVAILKAEMAREWSIPGLTLRRGDLSVKEIRRILGTQSYRDFWAERVMRALVVEGRATLSEDGLIIYFTPKWKEELGAWERGAGRGAR